MQGSVWVKGLRIFAWLVLGAMIIGSIVLGVNVGSSVRDNGGFVGFIVVVAGFVASFLVVAGIMVFLDIAENLADIRDTIKDNKTTSLNTFDIPSSSTQQSVITIQGKRYAIAENSGDGEIRCSNCGRKQKIDRQFCNRCGINFKA